MKEIVEKREVEELLGCEITDEQFEQALKYARHKQKYIYQREQRKVVLQHWYLVKLTEALALASFGVHFPPYLPFFHRILLSGPV